MTFITSIGPPPERHADRIVSEVLRTFAAQHQIIQNGVFDVLRQRNDGNPKSQERMCRRLRDAGAHGISLTPGKRGRYDLKFFSWGGATEDGAILPGDPIPETPWLCCSLIRIASHGGNNVDVDVAPVLYISHHFLSRVTQRCGVRTSDELIRTCWDTWEATTDLIIEIAGDWKEPPPAGWKVPVAGLGQVILRSYEGQKTLVATTVLT
jgi:hypothetical protein